MILAFDGWRSFSPLLARILFRCTSSPSRMGELNMLNSTRMGSSENCEMQSQLSETIGFAITAPTQVSSTCRNRSQKCRPLIIRSLTGIWRAPNSHCFWQRAVIGSHCPRSISSRCRAVARVHRRPAPGWVERTTIPPERLRGRMSASERPKWLEADAEQAEKADNPCLQRKARGVPPPRAWRWVL